MKKTVVLGLFLVVGLVSVSAAASAAASPDAGDTIDGSTLPILNHCEHHDGYEVWICYICGEDGCAIPATSSEFVATPF